MKNKELPFNDWVHYFGIRSSLFLVILMLSGPAAACIIFGVWPDFVRMAPTLIAIVMMFVPYCIGESIAYPPIIGAGAVYMGYITGNTSMLKMPCALSALSIVGVKQGTDEANAVSLIAVGASSLTVMAVIIIGVVLAIPLAPVLSSPLLAPAFAQIVPALMGALLGAMIVGNVKYFIAPICVAVGFGFFTSVGFEYYMLIAMAVAVAAGVAHSKVTGAIS